MSVASTVLRRLALVPFLAASLAPLHATGVVISYDLAQGAASFDPITIPNPQGGPDLAVTPSLDLNAGSFEALLADGVPAGAAADALIRNLHFEGTISIEISTTLDLGIISPTVTATLAGPLVGTQLTDAEGSIIGDGTVFTNTTPGLFDVTAGPLACSSTFFDVLCPVLETALGVEFPVELPALNNAPLPFTGIFSDLETPGASSAGNTFEIPMPLGDANDLGLAVDVQWAEIGRLAVPEPSAALFTALAVLVLVLARRRRTL